MTQRIRGVLALEKLEGCKKNGKKLRIVECGLRMVESGKKIRKARRRGGDVRLGEWSRRDASDIDGLSREAERSGSK